MTLNEEQMKAAESVLHIQSYYRIYFDKEIIRIVLPATQFLRLGQPTAIAGIPVHCGTTAFVVELEDEDGHPKNRRTLQIA